MKRRRLSAAVGAALAAASLGAFDAKAVRLDPESGGQVLIYPYYTVRSYGTDPFNTYISIVNTSADGKALKVRFREGKDGLITLGFNLFLSPNDTWTGALVPSDDGGTRLISTDASCVSPAMAQASSGLRSTSFSTSQFPSNDPDRTREGYAEVIEMATLTGSTLAAITQDASGVPHNCAAVQGATFVPPVSEMAAPSGGLEGTLTLINVSSGVDFTVNAEALADFTTSVAYTLPTAILPDLSSADPVSVITTPTQAYRLAWSNGLDAVGSVLMRAAVNNEYILDSATASSSDWVLTFPTRFRLVNTYSAQAPFSGLSGGNYPCEFVSFVYFNRESSGPGNSGVSFPEPPPTPAPLVSCNAATVVGLNNGSGRPTVFGSIHGTTNAAATTSSYGLTVNSSFQNGWGRLVFTGSNATTQGLVSLPVSSRMDLRTGNVTTGAIGVLGLPVTGFMARAFLNGLLKCADGTCQGAYGSAFPHESSRVLFPVP